ncbi:MULTISPECIES: hypothetical protein [Nostocales]|uniref:Uncharacterized protein n=2 Tax=Nostocales TaxID=1161 RepID=A0ABW8WQI9_9CYAN|nr:hypothetical protein [Tolypothrix bouteillei]
MTDKGELLAIATLLLPQSLLFVNVCIPGKQTKLILLKTDEDKL